MSIKKSHVWIIVLHWKHVEDTEQCLDSLFKMDYPNYQVLLINNDESDLPLDFVRKFSKAKIINNGHNVGFAKGNNIGIREAIKQDADYIMLLNNDTTVKIDFLDGLVAHCESHKKVIVSPVIYFHHSSQIDNCGGRLIRSMGIARHNKEIGHAPPEYLNGCCILARAAYWRDIGLLDEDYFTYFEDTDWCFRARGKGYSFAIIPDCMIWHKHSASTSKRQGWGPIKSYFVARNSILFARKNFGFCRRLQWIGSYLIFGNHLHLIFFCKRMNTLLSHYRGIIDAFRLRLHLQNYAKVIDPSSGRENERLLLRSSVDDQYDYYQTKMYYEDVYHQNQREAFPYDVDRYRAWLRDIEHASPDGACCLDFGCGVGFACKLLSQRGYIPTGIDISQSAIDLARLEVPEGTFLCGDKHLRLGFADEVFELIVCLGVLEHLPDPDAIMQEFYRVLKPHGHAVFVVPNARNPYFWIGGTGQIFERPRSLSAWRRLFLSHGFTAICVDRDPGPRLGRCASLNKTLKFWALKFFNFLPVGFTYQFRFHLKKA